MNIMNKKLLNYKIIYLSIIIILVFSVFTHLRLAKEFDFTRENNVTVFILDSSFNNRTGHGRLIRQIIESEAGKVNVIPINVSGYGNDVDPSLYFAGLKQIISHAKTHPDQRVLVNISLGFKDGEEQRKLIKKLYDNGVLIIAAAGNEGSTKPVYPAGFKKEVLAVANAKKSGKVDSSNYGDFIDVSAPGDIEIIEQIYFPGQTLTRKFKGTSFSAPRVTGLAAKLMTINKRLSPIKTAGIISDTAEAINNELYHQSMMGAGIINPTEAVKVVNRDYHWLILIKYLIIILICSLIFLYLWRNYGLICVFVIMIITITILPVMYLLANNYNYIINLIKSFYIRPEDLIIFLLTIFILSIITDWKIKKVVIYLAAVHIITLFILEDISSRILFISVFALIFYVVENLVCKIVPTIHNIDYLFYLLNISSKRIHTIVEKKLSKIARRNPEIFVVLMTRVSSSKKKSVIIKVLRGLEVSVDLLLKHGSYSKYYIDDAYKILSNQKDEQVLSRLIQYLGRSNTEKETVVDTVFYKANNHKINDKKITVDIKAVDDRLILALISNYGKRASFFKKIISHTYYNSNDIWVRYQALKTLVNISGNKNQIKEVLTDARKDSNELVRMEARHLVRKLNIKLV